ncbi:hypothetical protein PF008_g14185 [Phytophthora fragariae]|uniref:Uncharacterized protein n=1 Tax=Phytophthora fragariae TaxID=53985 RepID=A0A6G0RHV0_9STRA|nr:hypothetical protein PF008_g14185 [Phytophthora fragariae]
MNHITSQHPDYEGVVRNFQGDKNGTVLCFVNKKSTTIFGRLVWIVEGNLPFRFCENPETRRYTNLDPICDDTLVKYVEGVSSGVLVYCFLSETTVL